MFNYVHYFIEKKYINISTIIFLAGELDTIVDEHILKRVRQNTNIIYTYGYSKLLNTVYSKYTYPSSVRENWYFPSAGY